MTMLLRVDDLRAGYGKVEVLHGVSLAVPQGRMDYSTPKHRRPR